MRLKAILAFATGLIAALFYNTAYAGFGITPPYVRNDSLTRNSEYSQRILLTRSDPVEDLKVTVTVDVPGAQSWISVDRGTDFLFPKGESVLPIMVFVKIPEDAKYGSYKGNVRIVVNPLYGPAPGTVGISLGAQVDVDLQVSDRKILDYKIRGVRISDSEEGHLAWKFFIPGKIQFSMQVQNLGNVAYGPSKVVFSIYDFKHEKLLETTENTNQLKKVSPFNVEDVLSEIPTRLTPGSYRAEFKIMSSDKTFHQGEVNLSVLPLGSIPGYKGYGFDGLRKEEQTMIIAVGGAALLILLLSVWRIASFIRKKRRHYAVRGA